MSSEAAKATALGLAPVDTGTGEYRVGERVWYRAKRGRRWQEGTVTYANWRFTRVDWVIASNISRQRPAWLCPHGYEPRFGRLKCGACRRAEFEAALAKGTPHERE